MLTGPEPAPSSVVAVGPSGKGKSLSKLAADKAWTVVGGGKMPEPPNGQPPWWRSVSTPEGMFEYFQDRIPDPDWEPPTNADGEASKRSAPAGVASAPAPSHRLLRRNNRTRRQSRPRRKLADSRPLVPLCWVPGGGGDQNRPPPRPPTANPPVALHRSPDHLLGEILFGAGSHPGLVHPPTRTRRHLPPRRLHSPPTTGLRSRRCGWNFLIAVNAAPAPAAAPLRRRTSGTNPPPSKN